MNAAMRLNEPIDPPGCPSDRAAGDVATWLDHALPQLFGYFIVRVGGRVDVAEDLTQETILAAAASESRPSVGTPVMAWLYGIARHKLIDHYRREEREHHQ